MTFLRVFAYLYHRLCILLQACLVEFLQKIYSCCAWGCTYNFPLQIWLEKKFFSALGVHPVHPLATPVHRRSPCPDIISWNGVPP